MRDPTPQEEELAKSIVDEALEGYEHVVPAGELEILRAFFEAELVGTEEGLRQLRACMPDPKVDRSEELVTDRARAAAVIAIRKASAKK
ncbi:MAG: hypothetical protein HOW73_39060 [Polyangiaceae bacterium]|nr:hypothetical protein [Polyangiaceae bacterium]